MKYTGGIIRAIDGLGRVVIPMELRKAMNIEEGTKFEINLDTQAGMFTLKPFIEEVETKKALWCHTEACMEEPDNDNNGQVWAVPGKLYPIILERLGAYCIDSELYQMHTVRTTTYDAWFTLIEYREKDGEE